METIQVHFIICNIIPLSLLFSLIGKPKHSVSVPTKSKSQSVGETEREMPDGKEKSWFYLFI